MTEERYALTQRVLHWIIAILVLGALTGGWIIQDHRAIDPRRSRTPSGSRQLATHGIQCGSHRFLWVAHRSTHSRNSWRLGLSSPNPGPRQLNRQSAYERP